MFFLSIKKISGNTLKFNNSKLNKKEYYKSKQPIELGLGTVDQIVISQKFKHCSEGFKYFLGYEEGEILKLLYIFLPQMSGENTLKKVEKTCLFFIKDDEV